MTKKYVKSELKTFSDTHPIYDMGWNFLYSYSSKLLSLINDANELNCDPEHVEGLNCDLLEFQQNIAVNLLKTDLRNINAKYDFRVAILAMNRLKKKFLAVCLD